MSAYNVVEKKLEEFPEFRERSQRGVYLAKLAARKTGLEYKIEEKVPLRWDELSTFAVAYDTFRHAWGDVTRERKDLQGSDYDDKEKLSQEKQIEMGYDVAYNQKLHV